MLGKIKLPIQGGKLDKYEDLSQSIFFLVDVATEFDIQGLELDWTRVAWDGALRFANGEWDYYKFSRNRWLHNNQATNQAYQIKAYRVC